ncbi:MAG: chemotaxis protein CheC [Candidatus Omnitrophica bacterium]|nr:chemotaxis protein CheC [Candidatus Omnitrophota bacterium]
MKDEMDILREVSSIAAGHGSVALSEILGKKISMEMPALDIVATQAVLDRISTDQIIISVSSNILSGLKGEILFIMDEKSAFKLIDMCYRCTMSDKKGSVFTEMGFSVIKEIGNVIISSYAGALSMILKTVIIPSIPTLVSGSIQQALSMVVAPYAAEKHILLAEAVFMEPEEHITGTFYLVLDGQAMEHIKDACKKLLDALK